MDKHCKKTSYTDEIQAELDIARIKSKSNRKTVPKRAYLCNKCNHWHLTSKDLIITPFIKMKMENEELLLKIESLKNLERANVHLENENFRLTKRVKNQTTQLSRDNDSYKDSKVEIKRLSRELSKKESLIKKTVTLIDKIEEKFKKKNEVLSAVNFKIKRLESTIRKKDKVIKAIEKVLNNIKQ